MAETQTAAHRPLRPPLGHDWQEYMDGVCRCSACGKRRRPGTSPQQPCLGAGKMTVDG